MAHHEETGGFSFGRVYNSHKAEIDVWGRAHGFDSHDLSQVGKMVEGWMNETGYSPERPGFFKQIIARVRTWMRLHGFGNANTISDDEILTVLARAAQAEIRNRRYRERGGDVRYAVDGKYFRSWQDVLAQFKKDLQDVKLTPEQQGIYDVVAGRKSSVELRINDLNELENIYFNFGSRKQGAKKLISVHYAGLRNPVTAWEVVNIGDVIRRGTITENGNSDYPTSRRYELTADDGAKLKVIIDYYGKNAKKRSVINFYSDRIAEPRGQASSGHITDNGNISPEMQNANPNAKKVGTEGTQGTDLPDGEGVRYSLVTDPDLIQRLEQEEYIIAWRAAQIHDGKLYSPMAAKINGSWGYEIQLGKWEQADERPDLAIPAIDEKTGKQKNYSKKIDEGYGKPAYQFKLDKGNGSSIEAAYNPYIHTSPDTPLNDQFKSAYKRPELLILEVRIPKSELTSGYHAEKAKNSVGMKQWNAGVVRSQLGETQRPVILSRWDKPMRIVPESEVAAKVKEMLAGKDVAIPNNVVTPQLRKELEKIGVPIVESGGENGRSESNGNNGNNGIVRASVTPYYQIPFGQSVDDIVKHNKSPHGLVFVSKTPDALRKIGIPALPIVMTAQHVKDIYNDTAEDGRNAHGMGEQLKSLPQMLEKPVAIIASEDENRVIVLAQHKNKFGKRIIIPIILGVDTTVSGKLLTANIAASSYGKNSAEEMLDKAVKSEQRGVIAVFGANKKITLKMPNSGTPIVPDGSFNVFHNIHDNGSPVKGIFKENTESLQFRRWFGDSKVVDEDGEPMVVYHGTDELFTVFDMNKGRANMDIQGAFFSPWEDDARGYGKNVGAFYLSIQNPASEDTAYKALNMFKGQNNAGKKARDFLIKQGYDGVNVSGEEYIAFYPEQIKSATDNIGTYDPDNPDVRFSAGALDESSERFIAMFQPLVGAHLDLSGEEYAALLKEKYNLELSPAQAKLYAKLAIEANAKEKFKRYAKARDLWLYQNNQLYADLVDFAGSDSFFIKPSRRFVGEEFTGSWIAPEFVKHSLQRPRKEKESERAYARYLDRRNAALAKAQGVNSDEVAEAIARKTGRNSIEVEQQIIDYFRDLKRKDFRKQYTDFRRESAAENQEMERRMREEWLKDEQNRIDSSKVQFLHFEIAL